MREFWIRLVSMLSVVGLLLGYNAVLDARAKDEEIAKLSAQLDGSTAGEATGAAVMDYEDGTYTGAADGFGVYLSMAKDIIPKIIAAQSADVDTISGATFSSTGIKNASEQALKKAVK